MKTYQIYYSSAAIPKPWDDLVQHDVFLQSKYLKALEKGAPKNIELFYIGVFKDDHFVGVALIQRVKLYLKDMFRETQVSCLKEFFQNIISKVLKGNILVVGNLTHTGQHAMYFDESQVSYKDYIGQVFNALNALKKEIKSSQGKTIRMILLKDFFLKETHYNAKLEFDKQQLHRVAVQPNMVMEMRLNWTSMDGYVADLNKKYRHRYKRAKKKLGAISTIELNLETIKLYSDRLHELYLNVCNNAKFNTFILPENHFYIMKNNLEHNFKVFGYFLEDEMVGFYTLILNNEQLETYFLGYDSKHQQAKQLYLNMLYNMVNFGAEHQFSKIVYARTAMAIKSSVGAKPEPMVMYMKHTNRFLNRLLKPVFSLMNPKQDWVERQPFK